MSALTIPENITTTSYGEEILVFTCHPKQSKQISACKILFLNNLHS